MLSDEAEIIVKAGDGGSGRVSFFPGLKSGPNGGNGGRGGDVFIVVNNNHTSLNRYVTKRSYKAENGRPGETFLKSGRDADPLELPVPNGTTVIDSSTGEEVEVNTEHPRVLVCVGGKGGRGNTAFKSSTNTAPRIAEKGEAGQEKKLRLILKLIADCGFIGLPNAGKSSLLNELTAADVKTAPYAFTTLEPNLGVFNGKVIADIPGLIEGASQGRGLGIKFLKHIEKVKLLFHCISVESEDVVHDYKIIRGELESFSPLLVSKPEVILLTKFDLKPVAEIQQKKEQLAPYAKEIYTVSIHDADSIELLKDIITKNV